MFLLHHSFHTSLFEMAADCLGRDRLVLDVLEGFGDLDCSISLASTDKMNGILYSSSKNRPDIWSFCKDHLM